MPRKKTGIGMKKGIHQLANTNNSKLVGGIEIIPTTISKKKPNETPKPNNNPPNGFGIKAILKNAISEEPQPVNDFAPGIIEYLKNAIDKEPPQPGTNPVNDFIPGRLDDNDPKPQDPGFKLDDNLMGDYEYITTAEKNVEDEITRTEGIIKNINLMEASIETGKDIVLEFAIDKIYKEYKGIKGNDMINLLDTLISSGSYNIILKKLFGDNPIISYLTKTSIVIGIKLIRKKDIKKVPILQISIKNLIREGLLVGSNMLFAKLITDSKRNGPSNERIEVEDSINKKKLVIGDYRLFY